MKDYSERDLYQNALADYLNAGDLGLSEYDMLDKLGLASVIESELADFQNEEMKKTNFEFFDFLFRLK